MVSAEWVQWTGFRRACAGGRIPRPWVARTAPAFFRHRVPPGRAEAREASASRALFRGQYDQSKDVKEDERRER